MVERFFLHDGTIKSVQIRSLVFTLANYLYQLPEIFWMNISDIADTESVGLRNLSRIDDKSTLFQLCVESFEVEIGIRIEERSNNGRLNLVRQQRLETEGTHAVHQHAVVLAISVVTGLHTALLCQFVHGLLEGADHVCGRSKTPFAMSFLHGFPLVVNVERE